MDRQSGHILLVMIPYGPLGVLRPDGLYRHETFLVTAYIASILFPVVCTIKAEAHVWGGDTLVYAGDAVFRKSGGVVKVEGIAAPGGRIVGAAEVGETGSGHYPLCKRNRRKGQGINV